MLQITRGYTKTIRAPNKLSVKTSHLELTREMRVNVRGPIPTWLNFQVTELLQLLDILC